MDNYKTIEEIANACGVSPRHIQHLCRIGKIEGAVKKAGSWFIPGDSQIPLKHKRNGEKNFEFTGTKKEIFKSAITLFMNKGFENVSIKNIAEHVGISQSAMYNHFKSKQELLNTIYDFYCYYNIVDRKKMGEIEPILHKGSLMDIMGCLWYEFKYQEEMNNIVKIIFQRIAIDKNAQRVAQSLIVDEGVRFVEKVFNRAIEIGRLAPFDVHSMAVFVNSIRQYTLFMWILSPAPDVMAQVLEEEQKQYQYAIRFLTDLKPPIE